MFFAVSNETAPYYHHPANEKSEAHKAQALIGQLRQTSAVNGRLGGGGGAGELGIIGFSLLPKVQPGDDVSIQEQNI